MDVDQDEFSPRITLYGRRVRGPLDVLKDAWENSQNTDESVISYVLTIRERLESMAELVKENMEKLQKQWYDKKAKDRDLKGGRAAQSYWPSGKGHMQL